MPSRPIQAAERDANLFSQSLRAVACSSPTKAYFEFHKLKLPFFSLDFCCFHVNSNPTRAPLSGSQTEGYCARKKDKRKRCFQNVPGYAHLSDPQFAGAGDQGRDKSPHPKHPERQLVIKFKLEERWHIKAALFSFGFNLENPVFLTHPRDIFSITLNMIDLQVLRKHGNQGTYVN